MDERTRVDNREPAGERPMSLGDRLRGWVTSDARRWRVGTFVVARGGFVDAGRESAKVSTMGGEGSIEAGRGPTSSFVVTWSGPVGAGRETFVVAWSGPVGAGRETFVVAWSGPVEAGRETFVVARGGSVDAGRESAGASTTGGEGFVEAGRGPTSSFVATWSGPIGAGRETFVVTWRGPVEAGRETFVVARGRSVDAGREPARASTMGGEGSVEAGRGSAKTFVTIWGESAFAMALRDPVDVR